MASTVQMAHAMKLQAVAEGVETAADAAWLRDLGYDPAQGSWYSAALSADRFGPWLERFHSTSVYDLQQARTGS